MMGVYMPLIYTIICIYIVSLVNGATFVKQPSEDNLPIHMEALSLKQLKGKDSSQKSVLKRVKRNLFQFSEMISFTTKRESLLYNRYGNHCGFNWEPSMAPAVDEIDKCCYVHDRCYDKAFSGVCQQRKWSSLITYSWKIVKEEIKCADNNSCPRLVCECDKWASNCFAQHKYNLINKRPSLLDIFISPEARRSL